MAKFLDYEGLQELLKYLALEGSETITITRNEESKANVISANVTAADLGSITAVTAEGTDPLTLTATQDGTEVSITGSVDLTNYYTKEDTDSAIESAVEAAIEAVEGEEADTLTEYVKASNIVSGDGISVTVSTDEDDNAVVTIANTLDLTPYVTEDGLTDVVESLERDIELKQDILTAGTGIDITDNVISCTLDTTVFKIVESLPTSDIDENVIYVVPAETTGENNLFVEYIYVNGTWEKMGEFQAETDLSDYYTKSEVDELIAAAQLAIDNEEAEIQEIFSTMLTKSEAASTYQEKLTAGTLIEIDEDNVISADLEAITIDEIDELFA